MKKLNLFLLSCVLFTSAHAGNFLGNLGSALDAQGRADQQQKLQQCVASCRQGDGQCYQACAMAFAPKQEQQSQPGYVQREPLIDNQCFQACSRAGYQYGLCKSKCSY